MTPFQTAFIAFDPYPSFKGSAIHIQKVVETLEEAVGPTLLITLPGFDPVGDHHVQLELPTGNYLERGRAFAEQARQLFDQHRHIRLGHFRDLWGGLAVLDHPHITPVFEVNGFPSIELPYRYGAMASDTVTKLEQLEALCLRQAELIVTPSHTNRTEILNRGVDAQKVAVIPNGAEIPPAFPRPEGLPDRYVVYFGAFQPWQGLDVLLRSMRYLDPSIQVVICSSHAENRSKYLKKFAARQGVTDRLTLLHQLEKDELFAVVQHAVCTVAPLTESRRNIVQGCSPLKIFESMACGVPVVASDLPVTREIITPGQNGTLVRPNRPAALARAISRLAADRTLARQMGEAARETIRSQFAWPALQQQLLNHYHQLQYETLFA